MGPARESLQGSQQKRRRGGQAHRRPPEGPPLPRPATRHPRHLGSEFGRTPTAQGTDGRDHNPEGFTMWLAGGGVKAGSTYGATDDYGYFAQENKVHIHDFHATILALMGMDHEKLTYRYAGRDFRLTDVFGHVVKEVFA
nr:DUF1501 domain-containing protein [Verrucomicrobium spinosum]